MSKKDELINGLEASIAAKLGRNPLAAAMLGAELRGLVELLKMQAIESSALAALVLWKHYRGPEAAIPVPLFEAIEALGGELYGELAAAESGGLIARN